MVAKQEKIDKAYTKATWGGIFPMAIGIASIFLPVAFGLPSWITTIGMIVACGGAFYGAVQIMKMEILKRDRK